MKGIFNFLAFLAAATVLVISIIGIPILAVWIGCMMTGASARAAGLDRKIAATLMSSETVDAQGIQYRVFALFSRRAFYAITNSRIILLKRGLLGGFTMTDIQWKDLRDVEIEGNVLSGFCGSNLVFRHANPNVPFLSVDGVPVNLASAMYSKAQTEEQAWEEKRRIRAMEEERARSGGVYVNTGSEAAANPNQMMADIEKAKQLLDMGAISDAEFQEMKAKILGRIPA